MKNIVQFIIIFTLFIFSIYLISNAKASDYASGQVVVSFWNEDTTVIEISDTSVICIYDVVNDLFEEYDLISAEPLFSDQSPIKNIYLFVFPDNTDLDKLIGDFNEIEFIRTAEKNWLLEFQLSPNDYAYNNDFDQTNFLDQLIIGSLSGNRDGIFNIKNNILKAGVIAQITFLYTINE